MNNENQNSFPDQNGNAASSPSQRDIDAYVDALETDQRIADSLSHDLQKVNRFGSAVKQLAEQDLPAADQRLSDAVLDKLGESEFESATAIAGNPIDGKTSWIPISRIALAGCALLALGLLALMMQTNPIDEKARVSSILNAKSSAADVLTTSGEPKVKPNPNSTAEDSTEFQLVEKANSAVNEVAPGGDAPDADGDGLSELASQIVANDGRALQLGEASNQVAAGVLFSSQDANSNASTGSGADNFAVMLDQLRTAAPSPPQTLANESVGTVQLQYMAPTAKNFSGYRFYSDFDSRHESEASPDTDYLGRPLSIANGALFGFDVQGGEQYEPIQENEFIGVKGQHALSTFSIDVDTASYSNMRRFLKNGQRPPQHAIRIEELVNYFSYDYPQPKGEDPFSVNMELATCPWNDQHHLLRVGLKGKEIDRDERGPSNLVFLLDVSGSMQNQDKLPLLQQGLTMMVQQLTEDDSVTIVTYAGNAGVVLEPTNGTDKPKIEKAIESLSAGGSTNGSAGMEMAYLLAQKHFIQNGTNRVILATDGDLNVGVTDDDALVKLIKEKASEGVFLTVLGFGTGNLKDSKLEKLADNGNGIYAYIDGYREAHKVLVEQISGSVETIAKDVKIQVEFNPGEIAAYRLIGYENRKLAANDFDDDRKDAGEIGAGHTVTALYELVPAKNARAATVAANQPLKYQKSEKAEWSPENSETQQREHAGELLTVSLRYKQPDANRSRELQFVLDEEPKSFSGSSPDFQFAATVASFGMILRNSQHRGSGSLEWVAATAARNIGNDRGGYRIEFLDLIRCAKTLLPAN